jgi:hypothetical protein
MAEYAWKTPFTDVSAAIACRPGRTQGAARMIFWAGYTVDALHYLADLDDYVLTELPKAECILGHSRETVDIAHAYAAAATAFAAYDRCAAALGYLYLDSKKGKNETALSGIRPWSSQKQVRKRRAKLPAPARAWIRQVWTDPSYQMLRTLRHPLIHSALNRTIHAWAPPGHSARIEVRRHGAPAAEGVSTRALILDARDTTTCHVEGFFTLIKMGTI